MSFDTKLEDSKHSDAQSKHSDVDSVHVDEEPEQMPKWAQSTLQDAEDLVGDSINLRRTKSQYENPPHVLIAAKHTIPLHCYMVKYSYLQTYREDARNSF